MKIIKNGTVLDVTRGAFKSLFASQGWQRYEGGEQPRPQRFMNPQPVREPKKEINATEDDIPFREIMEQKQPSFSEKLENMTKEELIEYARQNGINVDGASKKSQIVSIIRAAIGE